MQPKFTLAGVTLAVLVVLSPNVLLNARSPEKPDVADAFDFPLGAPDGSGYRVSAGFGIQNPNLEDRRTCFLDIDGTHLDPTLPGNYPDSTDDHIRWPELFHAGTDWCLSGDPAGTEGDVVTAVANGVVVEVRDPSQWPGAVVVVQHELPDGQIVSSLYGHLTNGSTKVSVGQVIQKGTEIGSVLDQGDNSHLHWEIRTFVNAGEHLFQDENHPGYKYCRPQSGYAGVGYTFPELPGEWG